MDIDLYRQARLAADIAYAGEAMAGGDCADCYDAYTDTLQLWMALESQTPGGQHEIQN